MLYVLDSGALEDQITQARLSLNSAQASYAQAVDACTDLTVPAHASGTVTEVYVHVGDYVNTGTAIASLVDSANLTLTVPFAAEDAADMAPGNTAAITFPGQAGTVTGSVERVVRYTDGTLRRPGGRLCGVCLPQSGRGAERDGGSGLGGRRRLYGGRNSGQRHGAVHLRHPVRPGGLSAHPGGNRRHCRSDGDDLGERQPDQRP
ncbi:MAG: HlyD family efflux transporter periplasmic adaptor subunit [Flavonifractor plautii]